jgi:peptidoglycan/xylan/chitin deacetylase (PgdA/CDA1 family)
MYHSVAVNPPAKNRMLIPLDNFKQQMYFLKIHKYNVISLQEAADMIKWGRNIPPKTVVITFDDGFKDNYTLAFPILKETGLKATIFIIVDEVGRKEGDRLSWEEIRQMRDSGLVDFGSHALGSRALIDIKDEADLKREIFDSKKALEERLGRTVNSFAYPGGFLNPHIRQLVAEAGYSVAVTTIRWKRGLNKDIFVLKRVRGGHEKFGLITFWAKLTGYYNSFRNK